MALLAAAEAAAAALATAADVICSGLCALPTLMLLALAAPGDWRHSRLHFLRPCPCPNHGIVDIMAIHNVKCMQTGTD